MRTFRIKFSACTAKMLRMLSAVVIALSASFQASADEPLKGPALRVHLHSGEMQVFLLASEPVITFAAEKCHIASADFSADYDMSQIHHADVVADASAGLEDEQVSLVVDLSDPDAVTIHGLSANAPVSLYSISGIAQRSASADDVGTASISLAGLQRGVYIVTTNQTTFKIYRK